MASRPTDETWWIDERERRQREFISLLRKIQADRPSEEVATRWLRTYFTHLNVAPDAERRARAESYRRGSAELIAQLINHATPEQRIALDKKLNDYAQDFRSLAAQRIKKANLDGSAARAARRLTAASRRTFRLLPSGIRPVPPEIPRLSGVNSSSAHVPIPRTIDHIAPCVVDRRQYKPAHQRPERADHRKLIGL